MQPFFFFFFERMKLIYAITGVYEKLLSESYLRDLNTLFPLQRRRSMARLVRRYSNSAKKQSLEGNAMMC